MPVQGRIAHLTRSHEARPTLLQKRLDRLLTPEDRFCWEAALARAARDLRRDEDIVCEGDPPRVLYVALSGWLQKYKQLPDGRRQIVGLILPGEVCDLDVFITTRCDSSLAAVGRATVAEINATEAAVLMRNVPRLAHVLSWSLRARSAIQNEWMTSLGCRSAFERVAYLLCELYARQLGMRDSGVCDFPLTQAQIAEATGVTQVHVNRMIQKLRRTTGIDICDRRLIVPDFDALCQIAGFNGRYLHMEEADLDTAPVPPVLDVLNPQEVRGMQWPQSQVRAGDQASFRAQATGPKSAQLSANVSS